MKKKQKQTWRCLRGSDIDKERKREKGVSSSGKDRERRAGQEMRKGRIRDSLARVCTVALLTGDRAR